MRGSVTEDVSVDLLLFTFLGVREWEPVVSRHKVPTS